MGFQTHSGRAATLQLQKTVGGPRIPGSEADGKAGEKKTTFWPLQKSVKVLGHVIWLLSSLPSQQPVLFGGTKSTQTFLNTTALKFGSADMEFHREAPC